MKERPAWYKSAVPYERVTAWADLVRNWPRQVPGIENIERSLMFFQRSVAENRAYSYRALLDASIAFELLLGGSSQRGGLTERLATRGAILVEVDDTVAVYERLRALYGLRSKLVHGGEDPEESEVVRLQQFMMRALPTMARLAELTGSYAAAVKSLDQASLKRPPVLDELFVGDGWWDRVDVPTAWSRRAV